MDLHLNSQRPSIFELIAQEQLRDLLQPALKYVLAVLAQRYPRYLLRIVNRHEEFYALLMLYVENHYLRTHSASYAENFYGLRRRRAPVIETPRADIALGEDPATAKLRERDIRWSLFYLVAVPYLRARARDYFEALGGGVDADVLGDMPAPRLASGQTTAARLQRLYKRIYPWTNSAFELWLLAWNMAYLFEKTAFYRPWLSWNRISLRRATAEMLPVTAAVASAPLSKIEQIKNLLRSSPRIILDSLKLALPLAIFFIRFLEWWYSPSSPARALAAPPAGPPIPPPAMLPPHPQGIAVDPSKFGICPICSEAITNATATPTGYVFCYRCIYPRIEKTATCPVTLMSVKTWELRKIMV